MNLEQKYQVVTGTLTVGGSAQPVTEGKLKGNEITFSAGDRTFTGRLNGDAIEGVSRSGGTETAWRAQR